MLLYQIQYNECSAACNLCDKENSVRQVRETDRVTTKAEWETGSTLRSFLLIIALYLRHSS